MKGHKKWLERISRDNLRTKDLDWGYWLMIICCIVGLSLIIITGVI